METKRLILSVAMMLAIVFGWEMFAKYLYQKYPSLKEQTAATTEPAPATAPAVASATASTMPTSPGAPQTGLHAVAVGNVPAVMVGSDHHVDDNFSVGLFTNANGA